MVSQKKIILHIEDDARVSAVIATLLRDQGYHVITAASAQEGLRCIKNSKPDLIMLDMSMPGMSGLTVLDRISMPDGKSTIPVLIFTAYAQMVSPEVRKRVAGFLTKPSNADQILGEVSRILSENASPPSA